MANTYTLIGSPVVVGSGGASAITFSSIPNTFTDIKIVLSAQSTTGNADMLTSFNGSTSNFNWVLISGSGSSAGSNSGAASYGMLANQSTQTANTFSNCEIYIPNYASGNYKSASINSVNENNASGATMYLDTILWSQTAAINSVSFAISGANFAQYSTAYLYGISNS